MKYNNSRTKVILKTSSNIWKINIKHLKKKFKNKKWKIFYKHRFNKFIPRPDKRSLRTYYKERLIEKQKISFFYGCLTKKKLKKQYQLNLSCLIVNVLEKKIENILFKFFSFKSIFEVKQLIKHKKIKINNQSINFSNYILKPGDFIEILDYNKRLSTKFAIRLPKYIEYNSKINAFIYLRNPLINEILYPFKFKLKLMSEFLNKK